MAETEIDFTDGALADLGVTVVRTPVTKTVDNMTGEPTKTDGTAENVTVVFFKRSQTFNLSKVGLEEGADAVIFFDKDQTMNRDDKITYDGETFRVGDNIITRYFGDNAIHKKAQLYLIT